MSRSYPRYDNKDPVFSDDEDIIEVGGGGRGLSGSSLSPQDSDIERQNYRKYDAMYDDRRILSDDDEDDDGNSSFERLPPTTRKRSSPSHRTDPLGSHTKPPPAPGPAASVPPAAFPAPESISSISAKSDDSRKQLLREDDAPPGAVKEVYRELTDINRKLKEEFRAVAVKDKALKIRETNLKQREAQLSRVIDEEVTRRIALNQAPSIQHLEREISRLEGVVKEKTRENKRLQENFNTVKSANDIMRKEMENLQQQHDKLEKQSQSLQARLVNLQRKRDYEERKDHKGLLVPVAASKPKKPSVTSATTKDTKPKAVVNMDLLSVLLEWMAEVHIRQMLQPGEQHCTPEVLYDKFVKILPPLVDQLKGALSSKLALPTLQFIYWALLHIDQPTDRQASRSTSMSSTLRRLGEELYRGQRSSSSSRGFLDNQVAVDTGLGGAFFHSSDLHVRFLSSLVILMSISQVDHLAHVLEVLRNDLKMESAKELFIHYQATPVFFPLLKPGHKALHAAAVDIYLQLSTESPLLAGFLSACGTEAWFRAVSLLWRLPGTDHKLLEKLSILLQKLSKIKANRRYFEVFGLTQSAQELLRTVGSDKDMAFLALNLKSILFNLNISKGTTASGSSAL